MWLRSERRRVRPVRFTGLVALVTSVVTSTVSLQLGGASAWADQASCPGGSVLNVVAHPDDDLLFLSPDLLHSIQSPGVCVRTLYLTAGDAGGVLYYAKQREAGVRAAYAEMAGVADSWTVADAGLTGHPVPLWTLQGVPGISLEFLRLPDGNEDGSGFPLYHGESMQKLYQGKISSIHAIDGSTSYSKSDLTNSLTTLMTQYGATDVRTQDYVGNYGDGDHSDHYAAGDFARDASRKDSSLHLLTGYKGDGIAALAVDVSDADQAAKETAFLTYAPNDDAVCQDASSCAGTAYEKWWARQYTVGSETDGANHPPVANAGPDQTARPGGLVTLDGSGSSDPDGDALTYLWKQTSGTVVTLSDATAAAPTFTAPTKLGTVAFSLTVTDSRGATSPADSVNVNVVNHPPKANAGPDLTVRPGALVTLDGSGSSDPDGDALTYLWKQTSGTVVTLSDATAVAPTFTAPTKLGTLAFSLTVTDVYGAVSPADSVNVNVVNHPPKANAGPDQTVLAGATVTLDGSGSSDPDGDALTYQWKQTSGAAVTLSDATAVKPTFIAPSVAGPLAFSLTVTDQYGAVSPADSVKINVTLPK